MNKIRLKICGMKYPENIQKVAVLQPDYLGFIFYNRSKRNFTGVIPKISEKIKKTGVFVNSEIDLILKKIKKYNLKAIQLHGEESTDFCKELSAKVRSEIEIIKVFSVDDAFDFKQIEAYEEVCDYFLFDTKGKEKGGNGIIFNWELLNKNKSLKPFFLSGGIGLESVEALKHFFKSDVSEFCYAIDLNSRFEDQPGLKNSKKLELLIKELKL